jgi:ATP-dependent DNA ligase
MGCLKEKAIERQEKGEKLHFYVFDCLAWDRVSNLQVSAKHRFAEVSFMNFTNNPYVSFAQYKSGKELWTMLQEILARGDEGIVITHKDGKYEPGKRPSKTTLKIKKELKQTIDCFFTGAATSPTKEYTGKELETWKYWESLVDGTKMEGEFYADYAKGAAIIPVTKGWFHGWYGSLEIAVFRHKVGSRCRVGDKILEDTEVYPIGYLSGLTEEMKADPKAVALKPIEVTAMEWDSFSHSLRHGKFVGFRKDLTLADCTLEKIQG